MAIRINKPPIREMVIKWRPIGHSIALTLLLLAQPVSPLLQADTFSEKQAAKIQALQALKPAVHGAQSVQSSSARITQRLDSAPILKAWEPGDPIRFVPKRRYPVPPPGDPVNPTDWQIDPLLQVQADAEAQIATRGPTFGVPSVNVPGQLFSGVFPPDTVGDVGPTLYVQAINAASSTAIEAFTKAGVSDFGPVLLSSLGSGLCATGAGDPIVLYDRLADRWLLSEFSGAGNALCVYVSQTPDPGSTYFAYQFNTANFPDYPKYAVWPDAYYVTTNESGGSPAYAMDRTAMLAGLAATMQRFTAPDMAGFGFQALTPADLDGATPPPAGSPAYFVRHRDDEVHNAGSNNPAQDFLEIWEFHVDFVTPGNSTFAQAVNIGITEFDSDLCGLVSFNCFPQPSGQQLDPLREIVMWRAQYRNFGPHQSLVGNFVTDVSGSDRGGIRWFELRNTGLGWSLHQEGTYSPDTDNRWMGSVAMDQSGNIALGHSVVSTTQFTDMRYTGRLATDPAGSLPQGEHVIGAGSASQGLDRWGDYSALSVDPSDDCTFWHSNEYVTANTLWDTRIAAFQFPTCGAPGPVCGDGTITPPEICDDGNADDGDGCSALCQVEPGFVCTGQPSVCTPDLGETCLEEQFEAPNQWTVFNTGPLPWDWGTTDDGICWSANLGGPPAANVTGGAGEAACIDSDASGGGVVEAYLCSPLFYAGNGEIELSLLFNYQIFEAAGPDDFFSLLVGTAAPGPGTIGSYTTLFATSENVGGFAALPGATLSGPFTDYAGQDIHLCIGYGGNFDWYAQVDDVTGDRRPPVVRPYPTRMETACWMIRTTA